MKRTSIIIIISFLIFGMNAVVTASSPGKAGYDFLRTHVGIQQDWQRFPADQQQRRISIMCWIFNPDLSLTRKCCQKWGRQRSVSII